MALCGGQKFLIARISCQSLAAWSGRPSLDPSPTEPHSFATLQLASPHAGLRSGLQTQHPLGTSERGAEWVKFECYWVKVEKHTEAPGTYNFWTVSSCLLPLPFLLGCQSHMSSKNNCSTCTGDTGKKAKPVICLAYSRHRKALQTPDRCVSNEVYLGSAGWRPELYDQGTVTLSSLLLVTWPVTKVCLSFTSHSLSLAVPCINTSYLLDILTLSSMKCSPLCL